MDMRAQTRPRGRVDFADELVVGADAAKRMLWFALQQSRLEGRAAGKITQRDASRTNKLASLKVKKHPIGPFGR